jgi:hypothetical protein
MSPTTFQVSTTFEDPQEQFAEWHAEECPWSDVRAAPGLLKEEFSPEARAFIEQGLADESLRVDFEPSDMEVTDFSELRRRRTQ